MRDNNLWDINIRGSAVLGVVSGGGIGDTLQTAISNLCWDQVGLILGGDLRGCHRGRRCDLGHPQANHLTTQTPVLNQSGVTPWQL
jgi:hypothetical protein